MDIDKDAMVISNEGRVGKKEKRGKKKHKEEKNKDAVLLDIDSNHMENQKKRKREKENKDGRELELRNKKKKKNQEEEQSDVVDGNDEIEGDEQEKKKEKKKKQKKGNKTKDDMIAVDEEQKKMVKEKKKNVKKLLQDVVHDKTTTSNHSGNGCESLGSNHLDTDGKDGKADCKGRTEKGKKKKKDHAIISHEEKNAVLAGNGEMNAMEPDNQKEKKRMKKNEKEKKANDDIGIDSSNPVKRKSKKVTFSDELNVFPPTDVSTDSVELGDGYVRGKRFSKEEDEMIKKAVFDYIEANDLGEEGLDMVLHCSKHPKIKHCWHEIHTALPHRPFYSVYLRAHTIFERGSRKWTPEDLELVRSAYEKHGNKWSTIAKDLGKFRQHIKDAWRRIKLGNTKRGAWSQEEYQTLFDLVNKDLQMKVLEEKSTKKDYRNLRDNISWEAISNKLGTRNSALCTLKWYQQLSSPMVAEGLWTDADDYRLLYTLVELDASCEDEVDWENLLEHRSGDVSFARWKQMYNHLGEHGTKTFSEQVDVLSKRYCPDLLEVREEVDNRRTIN